MPTPVRLTVGDIPTHVPKKRRVPKGRKVPLTASYSPNKNAAVRSKPIILHCGRGDSRLTVDEARALRNDLLDAIMDYEEVRCELAHACHKAGLPVPEGYGTPPDLFKEPADAPAGEKQPTSLFASE